MAPTLVVFNTGPYPSFYNQVAAIICWGLVVYFSSSQPHLTNGASSNLNGIASAILLLIAFGIASLLKTSLPKGIAITSLAVLSATILVTQSALSDAGRRFGRAFLWSLGVCALLNCVPAIIEIVRPQWADGRWVAAAASLDRISGNIRQPNLLATMCAWGIVACAGLLELSALPLALVSGGVVILASTVACTGSRVGVAELVMVAVLGLLQRSLTKATRCLMCFAPVCAVMVWAALQWWSHASGSLHARPPDLSSGRYVMWQQCIQLIAAHPWFGVGMGNFNFAWTLTPFDRSNPETFDNAHNLILQWAVELGVPMTAMLVGLLVWSLWSCVQQARRARGDDAVVRRFCLMIAAVVLLHSLTEFPLWYAYFLLPTAFAWGIAGAPLALAGNEQTVACGVCVASAPSALIAAPLGRAGTGKAATNWLGVCGLLMALGAAFAVYDYQKIVTIWHPYDDTPIAQRVAEGRRALLYGHLADRFAGTLAVNGTRTLVPYKTATRQLLDMRLLIAWSLAMRESGQLDKARYLAQRVKDFDDPVSRQFFASCRQPPAAGAQVPWQCTAPTGAYTYEDFL